MNNDTILEAKDLVFNYRQKNGPTLHILQGVDLTLARGESLAIVGASGAGKSTLMHVLGGLDTPNSGEILLCGEKFSTARDTKRTHLRNQHLGFVYQFHHLLPEFSTAENVAMPLLIRGISKRKALEEAKSLLRDIGLGERFEHKPGELSGGERQRAAIARALIHRPDCLLADEPTGNLDQERANAAFQMMQNLVKARGGAMIIVTHDLALAAKMDSARHLEKGKLLPAN